MATTAQKPKALLSVTDKRGLIAFARGLRDLGYDLLSTGGTAAMLREADIPVTDVSEYTGSPEILGGRVKTLHPRVHGAILYDRTSPEHLETVSQAGIGSIDLVVVNLYLFRDQAVAQGLTPKEAIHHIDIGGPTMLRAAAKNWRYVLPVIDPEDYDAVLNQLRAGEVPQAFRLALASKTFRQISAYDAMIGEYLAPLEAESQEKTAGEASLSPQESVDLVKVMDLRYGENPRQKAALYRYARQPSGFSDLHFLQGKELSYNNILDLDAATALVSELVGPAAVIVKHTNPCGVAWDPRSQTPLAAIFEKARQADPKSAFGGIIAVNQRVDADAARAMISFFVECIAAPEFSHEALAILATKPNVRVIRAPFASTEDQRSRQGERWVRSVRGGLLVQTPDGPVPKSSSWRTVSRRAPTESETSDLHFAMTVCKHVKSNAIVFVRDGVTVAIGAGQMSRIDAAHMAAAKAEGEGRTLKGAVMASDAFFPFSDTVELAASLGVTAVIHPGGSKRDQDSVEVSDRSGMAMVVTGERHFRH